MLTSAEIEAAYVAHAPALLRYIRRVLPCLEQAEDVLGDVFVAALTSAATYEDRGWPISSWLYRIAQSRAIDAARRAARRPTLPLEAWRAVAAPPDEAVADRLWCDTILARARLRRDQADVIRLRFLEGCSIAEAAAQLGRSEGATKALQGRALAKLAAASATDAPPAICLAPACDELALFGGRCRRHDAEDRARRGLAGRWQ